jgi:hypothetical protein
MKVNKRKARGGIQLRSYHITSSKYLPMEAAAREESLSVGPQRFYFSSASKTYMCISTSTTTAVLLLLPTATQPLFLLRKTRRRPVDGTTVSFVTKTRGGGGVVVWRGRVAHTTKPSLSQSAQLM